MTADHVELLADAEGAHRPRYGSSLVDPTGVSSTPSAGGWASSTGSGPQRLRHHVRRPHPNKMITDQIRSTVYPSGSMSESGGLAPPCLLPRGYCPFCGLPDS